MILHDRVALVTGAGSGIGRAVAERYAREGAFVLLSGRRQKPLEELYDGIVAQGGKASIIPLDLDKDLGRVGEMAQAIFQRFGRLDVLVNNAATLGAMTPLAAYEPAIWETVFRVNVTAPFYLTRELLPLLRQSAGPSVIQVSSGLARQGRAYWGAYAASKAALRNLSETWSQELTVSPVRMNTIDPGKVATPMRARAFPGEDPNTLAQPEEVTGAFLYLASDFSREVRGMHLDAADWRDWAPSEA